jgi:hypothetical protein
LEGFGLVITGHVAGTYVTTRRTAGPDLISDGVDSGWLGGGSIILGNKEVLLSVIENQS